MHEGARRRQAVTCTPDGPRRHVLCGGSEEGKSPPRSTSPGTYAVFSGAAQAKEQAQRELLIHSAIAAVGILLLLAVVFHNWRNLLLVLANVPFALVGGVLAVWLTSVFGLRAPAR